MAFSGAWQFLTRGKTGFCLAEDKHETKEIAEALFCAGGAYRWLPNSSAAQGLGAQTATRSAAFIAGGWFNTVGDIVILNKPTPVNLLVAGYVPTAPACGDCSRCGDAPEDGLFCALHRATVQENARCLHWHPSPSWLRANPHVAAYYPSAPPSTFLSSAEAAYLDKQHTLTLKD